MTDRYPDTSDKITAAFIKKSELYPGYWSESEADALSRAGIFLHDKGRDVMALDAGCGEGRLLPWLGKYARLGVTAIEPDPGRLAKAKAMPENSTVTFYQQAIQDFDPTAKYRTVLCSHILQHVPTDEIEYILKRLHTVTEPGGNLVLLYSRTLKENEHFSLESLENEKVFSQRVSEEKFNDACDTAEEGVLPVHYINPDKLRDMGEEIGWREQTDTRWVFHVTNEDKEMAKSTTSPDLIINSDARLQQKFGRDMLVIWQKGLK